MKHILITTIAAVVLVGCGPKAPKGDIHIYAKEGDIVAVKQHLADGADVNVKDDNTSGNVERLYKHDGISVVVQEPIPEKLVVLTFDDSVASHYSVVRPLLKRHEFGATFFVTEGFTFTSNKKDYMTWEQIKGLHDDGFEIGNHTRSHMGVTRDTLGRLPDEINYIVRQCEAYGIPKPVSFAYPGNAIHPNALKMLKSLGIQFARRGGSPEFPYEDGLGVAYEPGLDHPLLIPSAGDARPDWTLADFKRAVAQARQGRIAVLQFHGVPDNDHPWVHTPPKLFTQYMKYLQEEKCTVIALRDLSRYVNHKNLPAEPFVIIESRKAKLEPKKAEIENTAK
jgi:peptidoglycan-N-acetylglucosamine deacetylase